MVTERVPVFYLRLAKDSLSIKGRIVIRTGPYFRDDVAGKQQRVAEFLDRLRELGFEITEKEPRP